MANLMGTTPRLREGASPPPSGDAARNGRARTDSSPLSPLQPTMPEG